MTLTPAQLDGMLPESPRYRRPEPTYVPEEPAWIDEPVIGKRVDTSVVGAVSFDAFLHEPDPGYSELVRGLGIQEIGVHILAGPPKSLKTMLAGQLSICLSSGTGIPFLGSPIERVGGVLFVEEEGNRHRLRERFRRQADGLGAENPAIEFLLFNGVRLDSAQGIKALTAAIAASGCRLTVLDPFSFLHGADENKPSAMAPIMRTLNRLGQENGISILAIHHVTKPQADRPQGRLGDRIRGASSITAGVDALFVLDRVGDKRARLQSDARDAESVDIHLELDTDTLLLSTVDGPPKVGKIDLEALLAWVTERGQVTAKEVMAQFGVSSKATALLALAELPGVDSYEGVRGTKFFKVKS